MDWFLGSAVGGQPQRVRREIDEYLRRHSSPGSDVEGALLAAWELIANALAHSFGPVWISLRWDEEQPLLEVNDLGPGFELSSPPAPTAERRRLGLKVVSAVADELRVRAKRHGGARVSVRLPVYRRTDEDERYGDPPVAPLAMPRLPVREGAIDRDPFLIGILTTLARLVEMEDGPTRIGQLIAQVGTQIGAQMEEAYRAAEGIEGRLRPEEMADLFVRLKAAIGGGFYVIEASAEKIVLGNRRCPFGELVKSAPALCHMTSSVFGGIGSRNQQGCRVELEERIALGDPECTVVIWLEPHASEARKGAIADGDGITSGNGR